MPALVTAVGFTQLAVFESLNSDRPEFGPSTPWINVKDVDGRNKPGHDKFWINSFEPEKLQAVFQ